MVIDQNEPVGDATGTEPGTRGWRSGDRKPGQKWLADESKPRNQGGVLGKRASRELWSRCISTVRGDLAKFSDEAEVHPASVRSKVTGGSQAGITKPLVGEDLSACARTAPCHQDTNSRDEYSANVRRQVAEPWPRWGERP